MATRFAFIDCTKDDRSMKRLARSHAMKGKNLGKKHHRRSREQRQPPAKAAEIQLFETQTGLEQAQEGPSRTNPGTVSRLHDTINGPPPFYLPGTANPQSQDIVKQFFADVMDAIYPAQVCLSLDKVNSHWLAVLFNNETSYHCSIALMATLNHAVFGRESPSPTAVHHYYQAVSRVNQTLGTPEALSDTNLSVVNFMVVRELLVGAKARAQVHLSGLRKMVQLRGGLSDLQHDQILMQKICKTDLDMALRFGTPTCFYQDQMPDITCYPTSSGLVSITDAKSTYTMLGDLDPSLGQVLMDASDLAAFFNHGYRICPLILQEAIISIGYRLLRFQSLGTSSRRTFGETACHIALIALTTTLFMQLGRRRFSQYALVGHRLKDTVDSDINNSDPDLMLWLLMLGGISVIPENCEGWLFAKIQTATRVGGVKDWADLQRRLLRFPWIQKLYDADAEHLWYSSSLRLGADSLTLLKP